MAGNDACGVFAYCRSERVMNRPANVAPQVPVGYCEGDTCARSGCLGTIEMHPVKNCSCHISPPCSACTEPRNYCPECDWEESEESAQITINDYVVKVDRQSGIYQSWEPRPLDNTKIDWHSRSHSNASMIKEGVYPDSGDVTADRETVRKAVDGTFGGRFEYFGKGKFKFIAYTD